MLLPDFLRQQVQQYAAMYHPACKNEEVDRSAHHTVNRSIDSREMAPGTLTLRLFLTRKLALVDSPGMMIQ